MELEIANKIFSRKSLSEFLKGSIKYEDFSSVHKKPEKQNISTVNQLITNYYKYLEKNYRNEYIYKNTLLNKIVFGIHSPNTTTALEEVTINKSRLDLLIINGKAKAYEIKTELDSLDKLEGQIVDYQRAFEYVSIVTCEKHLPKVLERYSDSEVGIYRLNKNNTMSCIQKESQFNENVKNEYLFPLLRKHELSEIVTSFGFSLPNESDFTFRKDCVKILSSLPKEAVYKKIIEQLKQRGENSSKLIKDVPKEIKYLVYMSDLKEADLKNLFDKLEMLI